MKLASFSADGKSRFGLVTDNGLVDLTTRTDHVDLRAALADGTVEHLQRYVTQPADWAIDDVQWLPPILRPFHIIGIGLNTKSHFDETAMLMNRKPGDFPKYPRLFMRSPLSHVAHRQPLVVPRVSEQLDYEGEIAVVVGKSGRYIEETDALEYVAGYACYNEGSVRDYQMHSTQVTAGKNFASSGSFGPWIVTADEIPDPSVLSLETRINGELRQRLVTSDLIFSFRQLIAYISKVYPLQPGDLILTGSPAGIGALEGKWLRDGDRIDITVPQIGTLSNTVLREPHLTGAQA